MSLIDIVTILVEVSHKVDNERRAKVFQHEKLNVRPIARSIRLQFTRAFYASMGKNVLPKPEIEPHTHTFD